MTRGRKKNDGRGRLGGRKKGTPNKTTKGLKEVLNRIVEGYFTGSADPSLGESFPTLAIDLNAMTPEGRARMITGLVGYVVPKLQSMSIEDQAKAEEEALVSFFESAPEEAIEAISAKVIEKQQQIALGRYSTITS